MHFKYTHKMDEIRGVLINVNNSYFEKESPDL